MWAEAPILVQIWLTWRERESQAWPAVGKQWLPGVWGGQQCRSAGRCVRLLWWWMMSNEHINVKTQELLLELVDTSNIWSLDINKREISACIGVNRKSLRLCMWHCDPQFAGKWPGSSGGVDEQGCHCFSSKPIVDHVRADELRESPITDCFTWLRINIEFDWILSGSPAWPRERD